MRTARGEVVWTQNVIEVRNSKKKRGLLIESRSETIGRSMRLSSGLGQREENHVAWCAHVMIEGSGSGGRTGAMGSEGG